MKKATTIVLLALCFAAQTAVAQCPGTWQPVSSGLSTELRALHFPTNQDGWAVGAAGKIIRSTDGGLTWGAAQTSGTAATLNGVHFVSASTGWAVGHRGIILKTSNGGGAWTPQASNTETDLFDVWFTDAQNGWVVGACGLILRTTDGGQQWAQVSSGKDYNIRQVKVLPNGKGFTTTTGAALIATANSGANWNGQTTAPRNFRGMDLEAGGLAFAASKDGQLLKSTDYGSTWANATAPAGGGNWEALYMASATHIVLAGQNGQVFRSTDGGTSWADFRTGLDSSDIFGLQMSGDTLGWAVGEGGKVFRFVCTKLMGCAADSLELVKLYLATDGPNWTNKWDLSKPMKTWYGVTVNAQGCVTCIDFDGIPNCSAVTSATGNNLKGTLPNLNLSNLQFFYCSYNQLSGSIPNFNLPNLQLFYCPGNKLSGSIPNFNLPNLRIFDCSYNQLSGTIPNFNLPNLQIFYCHYNQLSGSIPNFNLPNLQSFRCYGNQLSGSIPNFNLPNLQDFRCSHNQLSGSIPDFNLPNLQIFGCTGNQLSGSIPNFNLPNLQIFGCDYNQLSGSIPNFNLPNLQQFYCHNNQLSGNIPAALGSLDNLKELNLRGNKLTGCIPYELKNLCSHVTIGDISNNPGLNTQSWANFCANNAGICVQPDMVVVPGGTFDMGCFKPNTLCDPKENPVHPVTLPDFQIGKYEVTQAEWESVMGDISPDSIPFAKNCGGTCPMEKITWYGAAVYCNRLSEQNGLTPCYYADTAFAQVFGKNGSTWSLPNSGTVHWKKDAGGYRLPTEAEWEYAARGGAQSQGYRYAGGNGPNAVAWHKVNAGANPHPVGTKAPNELGLYDMSGNVWELCWDWYGNYNAAAACGPIGPGTGIRRMSRGGSFDNLEDLARVSYRPFFPEPDKGVFDIGFRLAQGKVSPNCTNVLVQPTNGATNVPTNTVLRWASSNVCVDGYRLSLGSAPGGSDILNNVVVTDTFYQPAAALPAGQQVYVRIVPFNSFGEASGCQEFWFVTGGCAAPASTLTPATPFLCPGESTTLTAAPAQAGYTYTWYRDGSILPGASSGTYVADQPGAYQVRIAAGAGCDSLSPAVVLSPGIAPSASAGASGILDCTTASVTLTASGGTGYVWSGGLGSTAAVSASTSGTYTVTVTNAGGCSSTATVSVLENKTVPDIMALGDTLTCASPVVVLQGNSTTPGATYTWSGPNGFTSGLQNPPVNVAGPYILTVQDPGTACSASDTVVVEAAVGVPSATIATPNGTMLSCTVNSVDLVAPAGAGYTYAWSGGSAVNGQQSTVNSPGTYTVTVTNGATGCSATASVIVEKNAANPTAAAAGGVLPCQNPFVILQGNSGTPSVTYAWTGPNGFAVNQQNPPVSVAGTYTLTVRNTVNGCTSTATALVVPPQLPTASITAPSGQQLTCTLINLPLQAAGGNQYAWAGPGGFQANGQQSTVNAPGTYTVTVTNTANGCTNTATTTIGLDQNLPLVLATTATLTCAQPTAVISGSSNASGATYTWTGPGGFTANGQQQTANSPGIYTVTATNPANGCTGTSTTTVSENKTPPAAAIATPVGTSLTCSVSSISLQASGGGGYMWSGGLGISQNVTVMQPGTYVVTVTSQANGCTAPATVVVSENKNVPSLSAVGGQLSCAQFQAVLQASSSAAGATFQWAGPGGFLANGQQPTVSSAGNYTCTVTDSANGCTATQQVAVAPAPVLSPSIAPVKPICPGALVGLKASGGFNGYRWSGGQLTDSITVSQPGVYIVTVTDVNQCVGTASVVVTAAPSPQPIIEGKLAFCAGSSTTLSAGQTFDDYLWSNAKKSPAITVDAPGIYTVTVTNSEGCTGTQSVTVSGYPAALALLLVSEDTVCAGDAVTFTAGGGKEYRFWLDGVAQGDFSSNKTFVLNNPADGATVTVQIIDANTCPDSTAAGDGPGREPISISVSPTPNLANATLTRLNDCPGDPVTLQISLLNVPPGNYEVQWRVDNLPTQTASLLLSPLGGNVSAGVFSLGALPPGAHTCTMLGAALVGTGCSSAWPASNSQLNFQVLPPIRTALDKTICNTQSVVVGAKTYNLTGTYTDTLTSTSNCDSIVTLKLTAVDTFRVERVVKICQNGAYVFYDTIITEAGFHKRVVPGMLGCDTIVRLVVVEESPVYHSVYPKICPGTTHQEGDSIFSQPGFYEVPFKSKKTGCDSIVQVTLTWKPQPVVSFGSDSIKICRDTVITLAPTVQNCTNCKYKWDSGATLPSIFASPPATTTFSVTITDAATTCKSTDMVTLVVIQPEFTERDTQICAGEALTWCGESITQAGEYPCTFQTAEGCDSTVTLKVTVFEGQFEAVRDTLSIPLGVLEQAYDVPDKLLQNDSYSGDYEMQIVQQPLLDSVALEGNGQTLRYILKAGVRSGLDSFQYALCPPNGCPEACDSAWVRVRLQNGDLDWVQANMPNFITPGEMDGQNDVFDPLGFAKVHGVFPDDDRVQFSIINRWGEVVHRPVSYEAWDGGDLPQATYYYLLRFTIGEKPEQLRGAVNLLR